MTKLGLIFDLDGTLIDSAPSILSSLQVALGQASVTPRRPLTKSLIGPPLRAIISNILKKEDQARIPHVMQCFKYHYDTLGYQSSLAYPGIQDLLEQLKKTDVHLYIATNKRIVPAYSILSYLGWSKFFKNVYALDYFQPAVADKVTMLLCIKDKLKKEYDDFIYIGDRPEDAHAAKENNLPFLWASWGYGGCTAPVETDNTLSAPYQIMRHIRVRTATLFSRP